MLPAGGDLLVWAVSRNGFPQDFDALDFGADGLGCRLGEVGGDQVKSLLFLLDSLAWHVE
jgi:hypothetical protein